MPGAVSGGAQSPPLVTKGPAGGRAGHSCTRLTPAGQTGSRAWELGSGGRTGQSPKFQTDEERTERALGAGVGWVPLSVSRPLVQWLRLPFPSL